MTNNKETLNKKENKEIHEHWLINIYLQNENSMEIVVTYLIKKQFAEMVFEKDISTI